MEEVRKIFDKMLEQNKSCREAMLSLIGSREAIAFVGAGLSAHPSLKYPSWKELLEKLRVAANAIEPFNYSTDANESPLLMAEEVKSHFASRDKMDEFKNILSREYCPRPHLNCTSTHDRFVRLPFRAFVTTNYDACLEHALNELHVLRGEKTRYDIATNIKSNGDARQMVSRFLRSMSDALDMSRRYVAHLHGWYDDPDSIILTASQYYEAYGFETRDGRRTRQKPRLTLHRHLAWALLATRKLVFFGCSMDDPYIIEMLKIVATDLWEAGQPIHFVVLPLDQQCLASADSQVSEFRRYGLEVVFYDNWDGTFIKLDQLLELASSQFSPVGTTQSKSSFDAQAVKTQPPTEFVIGEPMADRALQTPAVSLDWLEEVNEQTSKDLKKNED
jgi:hypothetical protein